MSNNHPFAMHNTSPQRSRHLRYIRTSGPAERMAYYDAQPRAVREFIANFPTPMTCKSIVPVGQMAAMEQRARTRYLASLVDIWGPDHPAVQDAKRAVTTRHGKAVAVLQPSDLDAATLAALL